MIIDDILNNGSSEVWWCETEEDKNEMIAFAINFGITYAGKEILSYQDLECDQHIDIFQIARNSYGQLRLLVGYHDNHPAAQTWQYFKNKYCIDIPTEHIALSDYLMG